MGVTFKKKRKNLMKRGTLSIIFLIFVLFLGGIQALGSVIKMSIKELTTKSDLIVIGKVTDATSKWATDRSNIYTYVTINVEEFIKGSHLTNEILIQVLGGAVEGENIAAIVTDMPSFQKGERVVLFLERSHSPEYFLVLTGQYGKFKVTPNNQIQGRSTSLESFRQEIKKNLL
jgi:hypothetical protein